MEELPAQAAEPVAVKRHRYPYLSMISPMIGDNTMDIPNTILLRCPASST
jgi:hypothetical protein